MGTRVLVVFTNSTEKKKKIYCSQKQTTGSPRGAGAAHSEFGICS